MADAKNNQLEDLIELMVTESWSLEFTIMPGCRCMSCYGFAFRDIDKNIILWDEELQELILKGKNSAYNVRNSNV